MQKHSVNHHLAAQATEYKPVGRGFGRGLSSVVQKQDSGLESRNFPKWSEKPSNSSSSPNRGHGFTSYHTSSYGRGRARNLHAAKNTQGSKSSNSCKVPGINKSAENEGLTYTDQRIKDASNNKELPEKQLPKSSGSQLEEDPGWEEEGTVATAEQYVVKPKTYIPKQFKTETVNFQDVFEANPDVSAKWLAQTLAQNPLQQSAAEMQQILAHLELMWTDDTRKDKSNRDIALYLSSVYSKSVNPFALVVYLIDKAKDTHSAKTTTLSFFILKEFDKWYKINRSRLDVKNMISKDLQLKIYDICTSNHLTMFEMAVRCFHLCYQGNDHFLPKIRDFLEKKKFKEAAVCTGKLGLQHHFDMNEIVLPLLLQDKVNLVETYVCGFPEHQEILVQYLDHLCDRETSLDLVLDSIPKITGVKRDKFQKKTLSKLAVRLMKLYKIPQGMYILYTFLNCSWSVTNTVTFASSLF